MDLFYSDSLINLNLILIDFKLDELIDFKLISNHTCDNNLYIIGKDLKILV